jgi:1-deoxy-D-xylulose-5-phosphate reductoisomerase
MGTPDMRIPIAYGIAWPKRFSSGADSLDLVAEETLSFSAPDLDKFPCLTLGIEAAMKKGTMPAILNAANEVSVEAFLSGRISFTKIFDINLAVINQMPCQPVPDLDAIFDADHEARQIASTLI